MKTEVKQERAKEIAQMEAERIRETFLLAMDQHQKGDLVQAEQTYRQILDTVPNHAGSIHNLGLVLYQRGNVEEAIAMYRRALAIAPNYDEAYNNLGVALESQGHLNEAYDAYQQALQLNPSYATAYNNLGDVLRKLRRLPEAEKMYREALRLEPRNVLACVNIGSALWSQGRTREAEEAFRQSIRLEPGYPDAHNNLGNVLAEQGRMRESEAAYRQALQLKPDYAEVYSNLGNVLGYQGRACEAEEAFRQSLRLRPNLARVFWYLSSHHEYDSTKHEDVTKILALLNSSDLAQTDAMHLHFALGKIYDDCKAYDEAFSHYRDANRIRHKTISFNSQRFADFITRVVDVFRPEFLAQWQIYGVASQTPVFIVGMPRSGTTLVEQIIASHPNAFGAGELSKMREIVDELASRAEGNESYPECVRHIDSNMAVALAQDYQAHSQRCVGSGIVRVLDKMPSNFLHLGLIALLFPKARIVHCQRYPLDTCLSIFFQNFSDVNEFAYDLSEIGSYYRQYDRLMAYWRSVLPVKIYEIQYEELVSNIETKAHELIDFLDLEWDERCLTFNRNPRGVRTSSSWQVRQPVYTTSVQRWRNYEKYLGPLKQSLGTETDMDFE